MPRYNVEHNGLWAAFSTIVDDYITEFMPLEEYEKWRRINYGVNCGTVFNSNRMTYQEAEEVRARNQDLYDDDDEEEE